MRVDWPGRTVRIAWLVGCPLRWLLVYQVLGWLAALGWAATEVLDELRRAGDRETARARPDVGPGADRPGHQRNTSDAVSVAHFN